jgi:hypothetical protein
MAEAIGISLGALGLAAALGVPPSIERLKRPQLKIAQDRWFPEGPVRWTLAVARARNKPLGFPLNKILTREAAQNCIVSVDYYKWGTDEKVTPTLLGLWPNHRESPRLPPSSTSSPVLEGDVSEDEPTAATGIPLVPVYEPTLDSLEQDIAVSSAGEQVAVAMLRDDGEAFGFSNEFYVGGNLFWPLPKGTYRVVVKVRGSNVDEQQQGFRLEYLSNKFGDFQLREIT